MASVLETFKNISKIDELKSKIGFTILILLVVRLGSYVTIPGIDVNALSAADSNSLFGLFDTFVGGAFSNAAIFALGIMPYITASIIFQLAGVVIPEIQKMQKEGEEGRRKINQYTRYATVLISALQSIAISVKLSQQGVVYDPGILFTFSSVLVLTSGTVFLMWLGEQITERGIGNGISLIIFIGIIATLPQALFAELSSAYAGGSPAWIKEIIVFGMLFAIIMAVVLLTQGARRIPVQYAKRQVGRKVFGGTTQYIPLRVNTAGVMPIIFAQALMFIPATVAGFFPDSATMQTVASLFNYQSYFYAAVFAGMVILFTYFYTAMTFNPRDISDNMKKQGGFIPGIRPGAPTTEYIDKVITRITLPGSIFLAIIAILPTFVSKFGLTNQIFAQFFGGTSLLIVVGVALDTLQQIESHLMMRHYDGFMKSGKIKGRGMPQSF